MRYMVEIQSKTLDLEEDIEAVKGLLADIQDFAVQDGPGLRVLVFLKGCPLRCEWCQNVEDIAPYPEIEFHPALCLGCLRCMEACPIPGAITLDKDNRIDRSKCIKCMCCVEVCLGKALRQVGQTLSVKEVLERILQYAPFFRRSDNGGITLSGGEPTFQPEFTLRLLGVCRDHGIHTAVETCGYANWETLKEIGQAADLILYDIKHMDEASHIRGTGQSNRLILDNLQGLCTDINTEIVVRIPLICGFNDDDENVRRSAEYVSSLKRIKRLDLLPFNQLASSKYRAMNQEWKYETAVRQSDERLAKLQAIVEAYGLKTTIGGLW